MVRVHCTPFQLSAKELTMIPHASSFVEAMIEKKKLIAQAEQSKRNKEIEHQVKLICDALVRFETASNANGEMDLSEVLKYESTMREVVDRFKQAGWEITGDVCEHREEGSYIRTYIKICQEIYDQELIVH